MVKMVKSKKRKTTSTVTSLQRQISTLKKKIPKPNIGYHISRVSNYLTTSQFTWYNLNLIATGDTINNRIGDKITYKSLHVKWEFQYYWNTDQLPPPVFQKYRVAIILDKQGGSTPNPADIWDITTSKNPHLWTRQPLIAGRFKVMYDRTGIVSRNMQGQIPDLSAFTVVNCHPQFPFIEQGKYYTEMKEQAHYSGNGSGVGDQDRNSLWVVLGTDNSVTAPNSGYFVMNAKLKFEQ